MRRVTVALSALVVSLATASVPLAAQARSGAAQPPAGSGAVQKATGRPLVTAWVVYHSSKGHYSIEYPAGWTVQEASAGGALTTSFVPPRGASGVEVAAKKGAAAGSEPADMGNTYCRAITVAGFPARRCLDTLSFTTSTVVVARGMTYSFSAAGKRLVSQVYDHMVRSFKLSTK